MASSRDRQRALARAKLERQMARRAAAARRRRQIQAGIAAAVALVLVVLGTVWLVSQFTGDDGGKKSADPAASPTAGPCTYKDASAEEKKQNKNLKDVGKPTPGAEAREGVRLWTLNLGQGAVKIELDAEKAPCNTESFAYLTGKKFFDNTSCHRLTTEGLSVLQCGDPSGTGSGGPSYTVNDENLPIDQRPAYPAGVVAVAKPADPQTGQAIPDSGSSQFFIVYKDSDLPASYSIVGKVVSGLDVVEKIAKEGVAGGGGDGKPKKPVTIKTATVTAPQPRQSGAPADTGAPASTEPSKS